MDQYDSTFRLPAKAVPYILREGQGETFVVAGQIVRVLAGTAQTNGGFGAMVCDATLDRQAIPLHFHEKEHDTWFCIRGRLRIWANGISRVLTDGDFAYVKPYDVHSYQSVAPHTQFFGVVAPGGWEGFFESAGMPWTGAAMPGENDPFDFSRMGPSMQKYRIMRVPEQDYAPITNGDDEDRVLPHEAKSYILQSGYGDRIRAGGHLVTQVLSPKASEGSLDMRTIEAGQGAAMPACRHGQAHLTLYVLQGTLRLTLNGQPHELRPGDFANIPAGTIYATEVASHSARWIASASKDKALSLWDALGTKAEAFSFVAGKLDTAQMTGTPDATSDFEFIRE
ncbi:cupin domain-containing protein [Allorhizobium undicola]|uniref:cupin domain-containing protein n=1 Tax=Allorhizobium undicola TaxID=78527 RepID=UPI000487A151|nr:quercetin 2,3-dioxygenase family protein [Allorhizobium undicola]